MSMTIRNKVSQRLKSNADDEKNLEQCVAANNSECAVKCLYNKVMENACGEKSKSWTAKLLSSRTKIAQKVGEEAVEVAVNAVANNSHQVVSESADLLYHLCVLWARMGIEF